MGGADEGPFVTRLKELVAEPVRITWTQNRSTMVSFRRDDKGLSIRLQSVFSAASVAEAEALAAYVSGKRGQTKVLSRYVTTACAHEPLFSSSSGRRQTLKPQGQCFDLRACFDELNARFFQNSLACAITWGQAPRKRRRRRRSMQLGCYVQQTHLIRIHPALDQAFVPLFVVQGVVFHEMIHAHLRVDETGPRRRVHPPEFAAFERRNPDYAKCCAWEKRHLPRLLAFVQPSA